MSPWAALILWFVIIHWLIQRSRDPRPLPEWAKVALVILCPPVGLGMIFYRLRKDKR